MNCRCKRYQRRALNRIRAFSYFGPNIFSLISRTCKREALAVPTRYPEQCASIFFFRSNKFFFDISIFEGRTGEWKVSAVPKRYLSSVRAFSIFVQKNSLISQLLGFAQVKGWCQR